MIGAILAEHPVQAKDSDDKHCLLDLRMFSLLIQEKAISFGVSPACVFISARGNPSVRWSSRIRSSSMALISIDHMNAYGGE